MSEWIILSAGSKEYCNKINVIKNNIVDEVLK